jgi:hypothetical protein
MKLALASLFIFATSFAAAQPTTTTFALNFSSTRIAQLNSQGFILPSPQLPFLQIFIVSNIQIGNAAYTISVSYSDPKGNPKAQTATCTASQTPFGQDGTTLTQCLVYLDAINGATVTITPLLPVATLPSISVLP